MLGNKSRGCRPCSHIAHELRQCAVAGKRHLRSLDLSEGKVDCPVSVENQLPLRKPVIFDCYAVEMVQSFLELGSVEHRITVAPDCYRSAGSEHALRFGEKCRCIQPVKPLGDGYQIDGVIGNAGGFGLCDAIFNFFPRLRAGDLLGAGVSGDDMIKPGGKSAGRLPVTCGAVQCYPPELRE